MADAFDQGLVLTMSVWGGDYNTMKWLDGDVCPETSYCDPTSSVTYSNIIIEDAVKSSTIKWIQN